MRFWKTEHRISSQHGGEGGTDTAWIDVPLGDIPTWLRPYGGSLSDAIFALSRMTGFNVKKIQEELEEYEA